MPQLPQGNHAGAQPKRLGSVGGLQVLRNHLRRRGWSICMRLSSFTFARMRHQDSPLAMGPWKSSLGVHGADAGFILDSKR